VIPWNGFDILATAQTFSVFNWQKWRYNFRDVSCQPIQTFHLYKQHACLQAKLCRLPSEWIGWSVFEFWEDISMRLWSTISNLLYILMMKKMVSRMEEPWLKQEMLAIISVFLALLHEDIKTYGFAFQGCAQLNGLNGCMPKFLNLAITFQLPRKSCGTLNWESNPDWTV